MQKPGGSETMEELLEYEKKTGSTYRNPNYTSTIYNPSKSAKKRIDRIFEKADWEFFGKPIPEHHYTEEKENNYITINENGEIIRYY